MRLKHLLHNNFIDLDFTAIEVHLTSVETLSTQGKTVSLRRKNERGII